MAETTHNKPDFDSDQQYLAGVYAKALIGATEKVGNTAEVLQEFASLVSEVLDQKKERTGERERQMIMNERGERE